MIIINEVWNNEGKSKEIGRVDAILLPNGKNIDWTETKRKVERWIDCHRPDLSLATGLYSHGYHAREE